MNGLMNVPGFAALAATVVFAPQACGHSGQIPSPPEQARFVVDGPLTVGPFENLTADPQAAESVLRFLGTALQARSLTVLGSLEGLPRDRAPTRLEQQHAASKVGASYALLGSVIEYGFRRGRMGGTKEPVVACELRLLEVASGRVAWEGTFARTGDLSTDGLGGVSIEVAREAASALSQEESK